MSKIPPCLQKYLMATSSGNRNNNLFTAMKKIKQLNPRSSKATIYQICKELNQNLSPALNEREIRAITKSIYTNDYKASCIPFSSYCEPYVYCKNNKPYNSLNKNYLKHLTRNNEVRMLLPAIHAYPWDIEDLSKYSPEQRRQIQLFRIQKGINPRIDEVLKLKGIAVGDDSLLEYQKHCGGLE
jgi:hypothetical protein